MTAFAANAPVEQLVAEAAACFRAHFGRAPTCAAVAPGRVNLIGEHTDYNGGFALPMAIERYTVAVADAAPHDDVTVRVISAAQEGEEDVFSASAELSRGPIAWANYVRGVVAGCCRQGMPLAGFDAAIVSSVPLGGGLSSSASLEVAIATLAEALTGQSLPLAAKALLAQRAEHDFAAVPCGIMDQFASVFARQDHLLLLDCREHTAEHVPLTDPDVSVLIANTNVRHALSGGEYEDRRRACEQAARTLGAGMLREVPLAQLEAARDRLSPERHRRARHVVSECQRTLDAAEAIANADWLAVGKLMFESHASLRDDFEVSCGELDALVDIARTLVGRGVFGSRMTGGGFGGCTVSLVRTECADDVAREFARQYLAAVGKAPTIFLTRPAAGAKRIVLTAD